MQDRIRRSYKRPSTDVSRVLGLVSKKAAWFTGRKEAGPPGMTAGLTVRAGSENCPGPTRIWAPDKTAGSSEHLQNTFYLENPTKGKCGCLPHQVRKEPEFSGHAGVFGVTGQFYNMDNEWIFSTQSSENKGFAIEMASGKINENMPLYCNGYVLLIIGT